MARLIIVPIGFVQKPSNQAAHEAVKRLEAA